MVSLSECIDSEVQIIHLDVMRFTRLENNFQIPIEHK